MLDTEPGHHKQNTSHQHAWQLKSAPFHNVSHMTNTNHPRPTNSNTSKHMSNKHIKTLKRNMRHHATRSPHLRETTNTSWLHIPLLVLLLLFMLAFHFQIPKHVLHLNSAAHLIHVPFFLSLSYHPTQSKAWCNERFAKAQGVIILQQRKRYMNEVCQKRKWLAKCLISQTAWYNKSSNPIRQLKRANQSHTCMILITKSICLAYSKYPEDWTQDSYRMCDMHNAHARTHTHTHIICLCKWYATLQISCLE